MKAILPLGFALLLLTVFARLLRVWSLLFIEATQVKPEATTNNLLTEETHGS
jgi:hypothetical protein